MQVGDIVVRKEDLPHINKKTVGVVAKINTSTTLIKNLTIKDLSLKKWTYGCAEIDLIPIGKLNIDTVNNIWSD